MELFILFWVGFSTGLSGAMIPGPLFLYTVSEAFHHGRWAGIKVAVGHLLLEAGFVALIIIGLRSWLSSLFVRDVMAGVGGIGLVLMGALILGRVKSLSLARQSHMTFHGGALAGGAFFSAASPGFLIWWATIGMAVLFQGLLKGAIGVLLVAAGHALADLAWYWLVAFSVERGRVYCTDKIYRGIMAGLALCLIVLGVGLPVTHFLGWRS